jgi:hypothetical protein
VAAAPQYLNRALFGTSRAGALPKVGRRYALARRSFDKFIVS